MKTLLRILTWIIALVPEMVGYILLLISLLLIGIAMFIKHPKDSIFVITEFIKKLLKK